MTELVHIGDGMDYEALMGGLEATSKNYALAFKELDPGCLTRQDGPTGEEKEMLATLNPDIFVADALKLTEDVNRITLTEAFGTAALEGYSEEQYALDVAVGRAVAQNLHAVIDSADARAMLPNKSVAVFEVNANRGFPRSREDDCGCHGIQQNWLGHIVVDTYYKGQEALKDPKLQERQIDYLGEPGSWTTYGQGLERNAARIRIRPSYPRVMHYAYQPLATPRKILEHRQELKPLREDQRLPDAWAVLRGEYRICRAINLLSDATDWNPTDFDNADDIRNRMREGYRRELEL